MTDFTPTPEAVEAVEQVLYDASPEMTRAAIVAFVEAEGFRYENEIWEEATASGWKPPAKHRLVGPWRDVPDD